MQLIIDLSDKKNRMNELAEAVKLVSGGASVIVAASSVQDYADVGNFTPAELANPAINLGAETAAPANAGVTLGGANPASGGVELDATGVPWDARIHSDAAERKTTKGVWKKRKGVDEMTYTRIHNELLSVMAAKVGSVASPAAGVLGNPENVPHQETVAIPGNPNMHVIAPPPPMNPEPEQAALSIAPPPPPAPVIAPPPPAPVVVPTNFEELVPWVTANHESSGGKLTAAVIDHVCKVAGLVDANGNGSIQNAVHRPDLIDWLYKTFISQMGA